MNTIKRTNVANVEAGQYIAQVDDDALLTDEAVNAAYDAAEQDWQYVVTARHQDDISHLTLAHYNGDEYVQTGAGTVWLLVDASGTPVEDDEKPGAGR